MESREYKKIAEAEKTYWWHKGKLALLESLLVSHLKISGEPIRILEIGCGTGVTTSFLQRWGKVTGLDMSDEALSFCRTNGLTDLILGDFNKIDLEPYKKSFDLVVALDVLEHIQDDIKAIKRVREILKDNGTFLINVPAHKFLWSEHDEALHHKRRYRMHEIVTKLEDCGFNITKKTYFVSSLDIFDFKSNPI